MVATQLSFVIPVYNGSSTIGAVVERIHELFPDLAFEVVLVNDGSKDDTEATCGRLVEAHPETVVLVHLARNFGEHNAVLAGLNYATGAHVAVLDDEGRVAPFSPHETDYVAMGRFGTTFLTAGQPELSLSVKLGEVVRFYLTDTANTRVFKVGVAGARMKLVGGDSGRHEREEMVEDVILGCAMPEAEQGMNVARLAGLLAGLPYTAAGMTVNRFCSSGLQAIAIGAQAIRTGEAEVVVAGGTESMSLIPMGGHNVAPNPTLLERYPDAYLNMGLTGENVARKYGIDRERSDAFALRSHQRAISRHALVDDRVFERDVHDLRPL